MGNKKDLDMKTVMYNAVPGWLFWTLLLLHPSMIASFIFLDKKYTFPTDKNIFFQLWLYLAR